MLKELLLSLVKKDIVHCSGILNAFSNRARTFRVITNRCLPIGVIWWTHAAETHNALLHVQPNRNIFLRQKLRPKTWSLHEGVELHFLDRERRLALIHQSLQQLFNLF